MEFSEVQDPHTDSPIPNIPILPVARKRNIRGTNKPIITIATMNTDGMELPPAVEPGVTVIIGGCNLINANAHNVFQVSGESIEALAQAIQHLPPESIKEMSGPLSSMLASIAHAIGKAGKSSS